MAVLSRTPLFKNLLSVTPLSLLGRAGTFLIYAFLANWFGATASTDFIYYYWGIAAFLIELLSAASAYSVLVPVLAEARAKSENDAQQCIQAIFSLYIIAMPVCCCVLIGVSWIISERFFPDTGLSFSAEIAIVACFACFTLVSAIRWMLKAILDTYQAFHLPLIVQALRALLVLATIYLCKSSLSLFCIPIALIIGELFQVIILFQRCCAMLNLALGELLKPRRLSSHWHHTPQTKQFARQCFLMMAAAISDGINPVVDRGMASLLRVSSVSKLDYALRLCSIPETLTGVTLPVFLSHWAQFATTKQSEMECHHSTSNKASQLKQSICRSVVGTLILMVPFLLAFYVFRGPIVNLLYGHGELSEAGLQHIASLLGIYLIGMLPRLLSRLLIRAHLARQNHATIVVATLIRLVLNPVLNWLFMQWWGLEGIAWSTALLSYPICAYIAIAFWRKF